MSATPEERKHKYHMFYCNFLIFVSLFLFYHYTEKVLRY